MLKKPLTFVYDQVSIITKESVLGVPPQRGSGVALSPLAFPPSKKSLEERAQTMAQSLTQMLTNESGFPEMSLKLNG
jgi:hypothetical protein